MKKLFMLALAMTMMVIGANAQGFNPMDKIENDPSVRVGKLENGLTYYIKHNEKPAQRAEFYIVTNVGAIQETPDQNGLAHFLEHMCFNGTKNFPGKNLLTYMESIGAKFGENINAGTGVEVTSYMLNNIPLKREGIIDSSLLILHDYAQFVTCDPKEIDDERGVIIEEWRTRRDVTQRLREALFEKLYKDSKYATCNIIGTKENLETFKYESLTNFYKTWYRPNLQAIIVVGDVDVDSIENKIKATFSPLKNPENIVEKEVIKIPGNKDLIYGTFIDKECPSTDFSLIFKSEPMPDEMNSLKLYVMQDAIKRVVSAMLNERFSDIASQPEAPFISASGNFAGLAATLESFILSVSSKDGEGMSALKAAILELEKAKRFGFTVAEFERAKTNLLKGLENAAENEAGMLNGHWVRSYINNFQHGIAYPTPTQRLENYKEFLSAINVDVLNQVFKQVITDDNRVLFYNAPEKEGLAVPTEAEVNALMAEVEEAEIEAPASEEANVPLMDPSALKGSKVAKVAEGKFGTTVLTLKNGIEIYIKKTDFKKDEVIFSINTSGGYSVVPEEYLPSTFGQGFNVYLQNAGLSEFPQTKLDKMLTGKVAQVQPFIRGYEHGINGYGSPKDFETMLQLTYLTYMAPRFNAEEYGVTLNNLKSQLPNMEKMPAYIFSIEYQKAIMSKRYPLITSETVDKMNVEAVAAVHKILFSNLAGSKMYIVGNIDIEAVKPLLEKYIGSLPVEKKSALKADESFYGFNMESMENVFEVEMSTPKVSVFTSFTGKDMKWNLKNEILLQAFQHILDMLYTKTIREEEGGTYGVGTSASVTGDPEQFLALLTFDTDPGKADKLRQKAMAGLKDIAENGPADEYFAKAKENLSKAYPERLIKNAYWKGIISTFYSNGRDMDSDYLAIVEKEVTKENIQKIAKQVISENMQVVIMKPKAN